MRTMLISLIVIFSLSLVARADDPDTDSGGCGTIYDCYAPESCTDTAQRGKPFDQVKPVEVKGPIFNDCPAIIRFFQYNKYRVHVSIESLLDISKIASIELLQDHENDGNDLTKFSCLSNNGNMEGKFEQTPTEAPAPVMRTLKDVKDTSTNKLKCVFEVTRKGQNSFTGEQNDKVTFSISGTQVMTSQKSHRLQILRNVQCDPADLEFDIDDVHDEAKLYSEIKYSPGTYFCEHEKYSMEYRLYGQNKYSQVSEITCDNKKFKFDAKEIPKGSTIMIRCAIEIKFLCDYDVKKHLDKPRPDKESPDIPGGKATSLKCPPETPHLMVVDNGKDRPILNPVFKCEYFGGEPVWTVNSTDQLTKDGPPVYCTNKLPCNELNPISESNIDMGFVSQADFLPKCHAEGTMWVDSSQVIGDLECDGMTGEYYYNATGQGTVKLNANTKFVCKYREEVVVVEDVNAERKQEMFVGITAAAGGIGGVVALVALFVTVFCFFKVRKERRKKEAENHIAFMKYCATVDEREAANVGKEILESPDPEQAWTPATTAARYECMAAIAHEDVGDLPNDFVLHRKSFKLKKKATGKMRATLLKIEDMNQISRLVPRHVSEAIEEINTEEYYKKKIIADNITRNYAEIDPKKPRNPVIKKKEKTQ